MLVAIWLIQLKEILQLLRSKLHEMSHTGKNLSKFTKGCRGINTNISCVVEKDNAKSSLPQQIQRTTKYRNM